MSYILLWHIIIVSAVIFFSYQYGRFRQRQITKEDFDKYIKKQPKSLDPFFTRD